MDNVADIFKSAGTESSQTKFQTLLALTDKLQYHDNERTRNLARNNAIGIVPCNFKKRLEVIINELNDMLQYHSNQDAENYIKEKKDELIKLSNSATNEGFKSFYHSILDFLATLDTHKDKQIEESIPALEKTFISLSKIKELESVGHEDFDLTKMIQLCKEINLSFSSASLISVSLLSRALVDHIPPIFDMPNFQQVANNYEGATFKAIAKKLNDSMKKISDHNIHSQIGRKELLPSLQQIDFSQELDFLLEHVIKKLN